MSLSWHSLWHRLRTVPWAALSRHLAGLCFALLIGGLCVVSGFVRTPPQAIVTAGQRFTFGSAPFELSWSQPAALAIRGVPVAIPRTDSPSLMRPQLSVENFVSNEGIQSLFVGTASARKAAAQRDLQALTDGATAWHVNALLTISINLLAACSLVAGGAWLVARLRRRRVNRRPLCGLLITTSAVTVALAGASIGLEVQGLRQLDGVHTLVEFAGAHSIYQEIKPATDAEIVTDLGPEVLANLEQYEVVSLGDSIASHIGGPLKTNPTAFDRACRRSDDNIASNVQYLTGVPALSVACRSAQTLNGLVGPQTNVGPPVIPQLSVLLRVNHVKEVIITIGANDIGWSDLVGICYMQANCSDNLSDTWLQQRLEQYGWNLRYIIGFIKQLPSHPEVIVNLAYRGFDASTSTACPDLDGMAAANLDVVELHRLKFNQLIGQVAHDTDSIAVSAPVRPLCSTSDELRQGPDLIAPPSRDMLHPTAHGEFVISQADVDAMTKLKK